VCGKNGHTALRCYKRFDANYNGDDKHANVATTRYNIDTDWYTDTGTTDHITSELDKLTVREKYGGVNQVHITSGSGMPISHVGQSAIHTHERYLILKDILHVPSTSKILCLSTNSPMIIMFSLNFTHGTFFLRIGTRRIFCYKEDVGTTLSPSHDSLVIYTPSQ
jgi:hypothetical protein